MVLIALYYAYKCREKKKKKKGEREEAILLTDTTLHGLVVFT